MNKKLKTMVTITIKETSKQAKAVIEMLKTFDFVDFDKNHLNKSDVKETNIRKKNADILALSKKINKIGTKKAFMKLGIDYDSYSR